MLAAVDGSGNALMVLWVLFAVMTVVAVVAIATPIARARAGNATAGDGEDATRADLAVYKHQLAEIEDEHDRGLITGAEYHGARTEIARRLLEAEARSRVASGGAGGDLARRLAFLVAVLGVPAVSLAFYLAYGSPDLPGQPLAARIEAPLDDQDISTLVARVEQQLADNPEDLRGWSVLAPVYMRLGRFDDAARAYRTVIRLDGATAERESDLGYALVSAADGLVTTPARQAFERALALDPGIVRASFYLAVADEQDGDRESARDRWVAMLESPVDPEGGWRPIARERAEALGADLPGPTSEQVAAADTMSEEDRAAFIRSMVDGLAARLAEDGQDLDGWLRLARAYLVLGDADRAREAIASARSEFAGDDAAQRRIDEAAEGLGIGS